MNRVLIITYYWPPSGGSGVQRWLKFAKYLPQFGWEPVIYTPQNPQANAIDEALSKDISPSLEVLKTKIREPYGFYSILSGNKSGKQPIRANLISDNRKSSFFQKFSLYVRGNFFIPDPRRWWVGPSVKYLKNYLREHPVDAIVSTGPPHSMHLIARTLHRETGIRWIADFRDPWTGIFYFKYLPLSRYALRKHRRLEQSVLEEADRIVTVSAQMKEDFSGRTSVPIEIITNGFDPADFAISETEQNSGNTVKDTKFRVVHTGLFTENGPSDYGTDPTGGFRGKSYRPRLRLPRLRRKMAAFSLLVVAPPAKRAGSGRHPHRQVFRISRLRCPHSGFRSCSRGSGRCPEGNRKRLHL